MAMLSDQRSASDSGYSRHSGKRLEMFPGTFPQYPPIWAI